MYPVSPRFLASISVSHRVAVRVRVFDSPKFGVSPTGGRVLPLIAGDVKMSSTADVKATAELTIPGDYWDSVQPFGSELFIERGIDYGDDTVEYVPLGYFRIDRTDQDDAPYGPIRLSCVDRIAQLQQNRVLRPYQVPDGTTHRQVFARLVNGNSGAGQSSDGYGMFLADAVPITWATYNPDAARVYGGHVVKDDAYEYLAKLVDGRGCVLRFDEAGGLVVGPRDGDPNGPPVYAISTGTGGNLVRASRSISRRGVYNIVSAYGSDPASPTGYQLAYNDDEDSPLWWQGPFGPAPRFYASPVLRNSTAADAAAESVLSRYTGVPTALALYTVPNPALRPLDVVSATWAPDVAATHVVDEVTIPLVGDAAVQITTRPTNSPPPSDFQLDPPGDGMQDYMGGTIGAYDPDTLENTVSVGGVDYSNLPMSGCCDYSFGDQVLLGYGPAGPMVLGGLNQFPSEDPVPPDFRVDPLYATPTVREVLRDQKKQTSGPPSVTLTSSASVEVGDTIVLFEGMNYAPEAGTGKEFPAPVAGGITWTARTTREPDPPSIVFGGEGNGITVIWTGVVTVGGTQTITMAAGFAPSGFTLFANAYVLDGGGGPSGVVAAAREVLAAIQAATVMFEDFTYTGCSANLSTHNDTLVNAYQAAGGDPEDFLRQFIAARDGDTAMAAAGEILGHVIGGGAVFEDFTFFGCSANVSTWNDTLVDAYAGEGVAVFLRAYLDAAIAAASTGSDVVVVDSDQFYRDQNYAAVAEAVAPSVAGVRGGLLLCGWAFQLGGGSPNNADATIPTGMTDKVSLTEPVLGDTFTTARQVLTAAGETGTRTATYGAETWAGSASIVVRGAPA